MVKDTSFFLFKTTYTKRYKKDSLLFLKDILFSYFHQKDMGEIYRNEKGKPFLKEGPFFSISHSYKKIVLVVSFAHPVGVDIEYIKSYRPFQKIAKKFFSKEDLKEMNNTPETFYDLWTKKEAFVKLIGKGILDIEFKNHRQFHAQYEKIKMPYYIGYICFPSSQEQNQEPNQYHEYERLEYA